MKLPFLLLLIITAFACKPRYDFAKIRSEIKADVKNDSLLCQSNFSTHDTAWHSRGKVSFIDNEGAVLQVDTIAGFAQSIAPGRLLDMDYCVSTKVKISVQDSTDLGYAGLVFDRIDSAYYRMLFISNRGTFYLRDVCNGEEEILIPKIYSRYLLRGRLVSNSIEIRHRRKKIYILFNGNVAAVCKLNKVFSYGAVGLVASSTENNKHYSPVKAVFENFALKKMR